MIIDLGNLYEVGSSKSVKKEIELPDFNYRNEMIETVDYFDLDLNIYSTGDSFVLTGNLKGNLILKCSRCLEKFKFNIDIEFEEELLKSEIDSVHHLELDSIFIKNIIVKIPIKPLCSDKCRGFCAQCGTNLNEGQCDCENDTLDPRLAKLKDFYKDKS